MSTIRPLGNKVLVRRDPTEDRTRGGLILPDQAKEKPRKGVVLRLGRCRKEVPFDKTAKEEPDKFLVVPFQVQPGDTVYFNRYGGIEIDVDNEKLMMISEEEILAYTRPE